jgi:hypothetical protein
MWPISKPLSTLSGCAVTLYQLHSCLPETMPRLGVLTAGEDQWAGVLVHGEVVQLQLAFGIDGQPVEEPHTTLGVATIQPEP